MIRDDLSNRVIHLTRGEEADGVTALEQAFLNLHSIVDSGALIGSAGYIRGGYNCVCFTEAPISKLSQILATPGASTMKYAPYGVMCDKQWLFEQGGRPVIYGPSDEFDLLPDELKYRHVRLHLGEPYDIDFTWEREWRLRTDRLVLDPEKTTVIVPSRLVKDHLEGDFPDKWHYVVLSDLGVDIEAL